MFLLRLGSSFILFFVIFSGGLLYTFNQTKVYQAEGMLVVQDARPVMSLSVEDVLPKDTASDQESAQNLGAGDVEDLNTAFQVLGSNQILKGVEQRLQDEIRERFMAPYVDSLHLSGPLAPIEILGANRTTVMVKQSKIFKVRYKHPDPIIAAEVSNLFMKEFIDYYLKEEIDGYMKMVEDLRIRIKMTDERIEEHTEQISLLVKDGGSSETKLRLLTDERDVMIDFRSKLYKAFTESKTHVMLANPRARIVDAAYPPHPNQPHSPNVLKNLSYAFSAGLFFAAIPHFWVIFRRRSNI